MCWASIMGKVISYCNGMTIMSGDKSVNICVVSTLPRIVYTISGRLDTATYNFEVYSSMVKN